MKGDVCLVDVFSFVFVHRKAVFGTQMCPLKPKIAFHVSQQFQDVPGKGWNWLLVFVHQQQRQTVFVLVCVRQVHRPSCDAFFFDFLHFFPFLHCQNFVPFQHFLRFLRFLRSLHFLPFLSRISITSSRSDQRQFHRWWFRCHTLLPQQRAAQFHQLRKAMQFPNGQLTVVGVFQLVIHVLQSPGTFDNEFLFRRQQFLQILQSQYLRRGLAAQVIFVLVLVVFHCVGRRVARKVGGHTAAAAAAAAAAAIKCTATLLQQIYFATVFGLLVQGPLHFYAFPFDKGLLCPVHIAAHCGRSVAFGTQKEHTERTHRKEHTERTKTETSVSTFDGKTLAKHLQNTYHRHRPTLP